MLIDKIFKNFSRIEINHRNQINEIRKNNNSIIGWETKNLNCVNGLDLGLNPKNNNYSIVKFNSYANLDNISVITDNELYGGDTVCEVDYNLKEDSRKQINI